MNAAVSTSINPASDRASNPASNPAIVSLNPAHRSVINSADLDGLNRDLQDASADEIVAYALARANNPILTTNFRPHSAAFLHLVTRIAPDIPVLWVDNGYNTDATYRFAADVTERLNLNLEVVTPAWSPARWSALYGGVPNPDEPEFDRFTRAVKLDPFNTALQRIKPDVWLTGVRREQTEFRRAMKTVSAGPQGAVKFAPILAWSELDVEAYLYDNDLPDNDDYNDPTKPAADRECGLQLLQ